MSKVIIYSTPTCAWCKKAKEYFQANDVDYTEVNVAGDPAKVQELVEKSGQMGVPVIDIDGMIVVGFNKGKLDELLSIGEKVAN